MAHFNFVISQNAKWGHAGFYIDRHRMTSSKYAYRKVLFYKKKALGENIRPTNTAFAINLTYVFIFTAIAYNNSYWEKSARRQKKEHTREPADVKMRVRN